MNPLISVADLQAIMDDSKLVILDATIPKAGQVMDEGAVKGIPGALYMDLKKRFADPESLLPNTVPSPELFQESARVLGVNKDSKIVVYDQHGIYSSPRAWFLFRAMGHKHIQVLNGGLLAWCNAGKQITEIKSKAGAKGDFIASFDPTFFTNKSEVLANIDKKTFQILDARPAGRFWGKVPEPRKGLRGGHIPGSSSFPLNDVVRKGHFISKDEIAKILTEANPEGKPLVYSCGSGITACGIALASELVDAPRGKVYDGSWTEWGGDEEMPLE